MSPSGPTEIPPVAARPRERLAVLTCMDARIDPCAILGLKLGDAHIIRNAGGLVTADAVRSLTASQRLLDTNRIVILMHDGCGLHGASDARFASLLEAEGAVPAWRLGGFEDVEEAVARGILRLRASPELLHREDIKAYIYDPETGRVREPQVNLQAVADSAGDLPDI